MFTRDVKCGSCGREGKVEAHDTVNIVPESEIFELLGKDSSTGYIHLRCPSCKADLAVDPFKVIGASQMIGYPTSANSGSLPQKNRRYVPLIFGAICVLVTLFVLYTFSGLWTYIIAGFFLMVAWGSIKTGLFASDKEIGELTAAGPLSEDTKDKFQDRLS
jgi:hypothetical protein